MLRAAAALFAFSLAFAGAPARADEADGIDCAHAENQNDMNLCADKDYRKADAALNLVYLAAMKGLDDLGRDLLRKSERAWIAFRDAECAYQNQPNEGGSIYPLVYAGCLTTLTKARTVQLKAGQN